MSPAEPRRAAVSTDRPSGQVRPDDFRAAMAQLPAGVAVVSAGHQGTLHAMTATAFTSVSLEPPMVLVCVGRAARIHAPLLSAGAWSVSILAAGQEDVARRFATSGRDLATQFDGVPHHRAPFSRAAVLDDASSWLDCITADTYAAGDHTVVIGSVRAVGWRDGPATGLIYWQSGYTDI